jgi:hypothetical protein
LIRGGYRFAGRKRVKESSLGSDSIKTDRALAAHSIRDRNSRRQTALHATLLDMPERPLRGGICPRELTAVQIPRFIADRAAENRKIIYLHCQRAYLAQTNRLFCPKTGTGTVQFLIRHFAFLGFEGQYWMLVAAGLIAVFIFFAWKNRHRN